MDNKFPSKLIAMELVKIINKIIDLFFMVILLFSHAKNSWGI